MGAVRRGVDWVASASFNASDIRPLRFSHADPVERMEFRRKPARGRSRHRLVSGGVDNLGQIAHQQVLGGTARDGGVQLRFTDDLLLADGPAAVLEPQSGPPCGKPGRSRGRWVRFAWQ